MPKVEMWIGQDTYIALMHEAAEIGMSIGEYMKYTFMAAHEDGIDGGKVLGAKVKIAREKAREKGERMDRPRGVV